MMKQTQIDLANYRISDAKEKIESAKILLHEKHFKDSLSRSYYAMFSAVRALLALKEVRHSGIISRFDSDSAVGSEENLFDKFKCLVQ
jgi:uncharacterized protein (UPF0332 family)